MWIYDPRFNDFLQVHCLVSLRFCTHYYRERFRSVRVYITAMTSRSVRIISTSRQWIAKLIAFLSISLWRANRFVCLFVFIFLVLGVPNSSISKSLAWGWIDFVRLNWIASRDSILQRFVLVHTLRSECHIGSYVECFSIQRVYCRLNACMQGSCCLDGTHNSGWFERWVCEQKTLFLTIYCTTDLYVSIASRIYIHLSM